MNFEDIAESADNPVMRELEEAPQMGGAFRCHVIGRFHEVFRCCMDDLLDAARNANLKELCLTDIGGAGPPNSFWGLSYT